MARFPQKEKIRRSRLRANALALDASRFVRAHGDLELAEDGA
jgi:hypothetical protein